MKNAIIILGGGNDMKGSLSEFTVQRVLAGVELYFQGKAKNIVMSGKFSFALDSAPVMTEASAMKELALSLGVPEKDIFLEEQSVDTLGNAFYTKTLILLSKNWKDIYVVTSDFHIPRSEMLFQKVFGRDYLFEFISAPSGLSIEQLEIFKNREKRVIRIINQWLVDIEDGDDESVYNIMFTIHPGYASNPKISKTELLRMIEGG